MLSEVKGVVLRSVDLTENDKLLTILTHEKGRITAVANGSKSLKSRYRSSTEMFCYGKYFLYQKGDKYWVRDVDLVESFFDLRCDLESMALANYVCDVAHESSTEDLSDEDMLRLVLNTLYAITKKIHSTQHIKAVFELRAATVLGFMPDIEMCHICGKENDEFFLDVMNGNITCKECRNEEISSFNAQITDDPRERRIICILTPVAAKAARYIITCDATRIFAFHIKEEDMNSLAYACEQYLLNHIERGFKSLDFYKQVASI